MSGSTQREALREACRLSGARWAAWVVTGPQGWQVVLDAGLRSSERRQLAQWLRGETAAQWLAQARTRSRRWRLGEAGEAVRLTVVPLGPESALLVGSEAPVERGVWRLVARLWEGANAAEKKVTPPPLEEVPASLREDPRIPARWQVMWETTLDISANLDVDTVLQRTVERVKQILEARGAEIGLVEREKGRVRIVASAAPWRDYTGRTFPLGKGVAGWTAATGETVRVADFNRWERRKSATFNAPFRSVVSVPLRHQGQILGVLTAYDDRVARFTAEDERFLEMLAASVAVALRNARLYEDLQRVVRELEDSRQRMVQSAKLATMGRLMAIVAHEINNPLQAVLNSLHLAARTDMSLSQREEYLRLARQELLRLRDIVQQMLAYYRPNGTERRPVALTQVVEQVLHLVEGQCARQGITVRNQMPQELPWVLGHFGQLQQVVLNLVVNALEAMPSGGVLTLAGWAEDDRVVLEVRDTGPGVPPEVRERLFEPFVTTKAHGVGLGLAVSYSILEAHQGTLSYCASEGEEQGACFRITLPRLVVEKESPKEAEA